MTRMQKAKAKLLFHAAQVAAGVAKTTSELKQLELAAAATAPSTATPAPLASDHGWRHRVALRRAACPMATLPARAQM